MLTKRIIACMDVRDGQVVKGVQFQELRHAGDPAALTDLYRAFQPRLLRYLRAREPGLADDIAGETWLAVAQRISAFSGDATAFSAWVFTIARQRMSDGRRTAARGRPRP